MRLKTVITKLLQSFTKVYLKVGQVLQSTSALQSVTEVDYKVRWVLQSASITMFDRLLLQSVAGITKGDTLSQFETKHL